MMLQQPQQHRYDDLLLGLEVFAQIGFVSRSDDEKIKHDALQRWECYNISRSMLPSLTQCHETTVV